MLVNHTKRSSIAAINFHLSDFLSWNSKTYTHMWKILYANSLETILNCFRFSVFSLKLFLCVRLKSRAKKNNKKNLRPRAGEIMPRKVADRYQTRCRECSIFDFRLTLFLIQSKTFLFDLLHLVLLKQTFHNSPWWLWLD